MIVFFSVRYVTTSLWDTQADEPEAHASMRSALYVSLQHVLTQTMSLDINSDESPSLGSLTPVGISLWECVSMCVSAVRKSLYAAALWSNLVQAQFYFE